MTSNTPSPRTATTAGPFACGSQTRPTSVPLRSILGEKIFYRQCRHGRVLALSRIGHAEIAADPIGEDQ